MNASKNPFRTAVYQEVFQEILGTGGMTNQDECLAEMDEPMGRKISFLPGQAAHRTSQCKAFVTTTADAALLVAVFDLYGKFYTCYKMKLCDMRNLVIKKVFGGVTLSFAGETQLGRATMRMYLPKHDFGSDLKEQKVHLQRLVSNLQTGYTDKQGI